MTDDTFGPETLGSADLPTARRGYDKKAVKELIDRVSREWAAMQSRLDGLEAMIAAEGGAEHLARDLGAVAADVGRILADATSTAAGIRERATEAAERVTVQSETEAEARLGDARQRADSLVAEATGTAEHLRHETDEETFRLRKAAWEAGTMLLAQARDAARHIVTAADDDVLVTRADAEKDAHRRMATAKAEAEDVVRNARYEASRIVGAAREMAEEIASRSEESEADAPSSAPTSGPTVAPGVTILDPQRAEPPLRVVPGDPVGFGELDPQQANLSDALAAEVESLGDSTEETGSAPEGAPDSETGGDGKVTAEEPIAAVPSPGVDPEEDEAGVGSIFDRLRSTAEHEPVVAPAGDPVERRDRLVLPAFNLGAREAKRRIVDIQNRALDAVRTGSEPAGPGGLADELGSALKPMIDKAASAGAAAVEEITGKAVVAVPGGRPEEMIAEMSEGLSAQVGAAASGESSDPTAEVSRVFRSWRTDEGERWIRAVANAAYHDALLAGLAEAGVGSVVGVASGPLCDRCPASSGKTWSPGQDPPEGAQVPPATPDCACTLAPPRLD